MTISGILGKGNITGQRVRVELPDEVYDGIPTLVTIHLENRRRLPSYLIRVALQGQSVSFPVIDRNGADAAALMVSFSGRGRHRLPPVELSSIFPINFFVRRRLLSPDGEVTIFPAPRPCQATDDTPEGRPRGITSASERGHEGDINRIGDYRGNEPLKLIHWKLSARHDQLKVKELSSTNQEPVIIELARLPAAGIEERLGCACYLIRELTRQGKPVGLKFQDRLVRPGTGQRHKLRLLSELSAYGQN